MLMLLLSLFLLVCGIAISAVAFVGWMTLSFTNSNRDNFGVAFCFVLALLAFYGSAHFAPFTVTWTG